MPASAVNLRVEPHRGWQSWKVGGASSVVEVLVVQWVMQGQVHAIIVLLFKLFEGKLLIKVKSIFTDSEKNCQCKKLNKLYILIINIEEHRVQLKVLLHCSSPSYFPLLELF